MLHCSFTQVWVAHARYEGYKLHVGDLLPGTLADDIVHWLVVTELTPEELLHVIDIHCTIAAASGSGHLSL